MTGKSNKRAQGSLSEEKALRFLESQGLRFIEKNFNTRGGEIDLIMQDKDLLVFVEVRTRWHEVYGSAVESVTRPKQRRIIRTALLYLQKMRLLDKVPCRFDIIGIDGDKEIDWIPNAFQ